MQNHHRSWKQNPCQAVDNLLSKPCAKNAQAWGTLSLLLCVALFFDIPPLHAQDASARQREVAAVYRLAGQPTGTYHETTAPDVSGGMVTSIDSDLVFNRLGSKLEMKFTTQYHEDGQGHLKSVSSDQSSSQQVTHLEVQVGDASLAITTTTGGKSYEHAASFKGILLGPDSARHLLTSRLRMAGDSVSYHTFSAELGAVVTITSSLLASEDIAINGEKVSGLKIEQTIDAMPGTSTLWLDHQGWLLRQIVPSPLGEIEALRDNANGLSSAVTGATLPEETFSRSIVKANIRLPEERLIEKIRLKLIQKRPDLGWPDLETDNQHVLEKTANYVVLDVRRVEPKVRASRPLVTNDASLAPFLPANALLQSDDANIREIAANVAGGDHDAWSAAQALQRWTNDNMKFDLGIAIAPASEVARDRRGTCFGYSMLLGSLARAAGIPSRLRMGYVYAGGIWGGHAWVEVRIGNSWIPIDGALYSPGAADAARFSFYTSGLENGTLTGMGSLAQLFSNVDIKILRYTVGGKSIDVPENAEPFVLSGDDYQNRWLGLSIRKPTDFEFADLDSGWPQTEVVSMEGLRGESVRVKNLSASLPTGDFDVQKEFAEQGIDGKGFSTTIAGYKVILATSGEKAEAILSSTGNIWVFTSTGSKPKQMLEQVMATMSLSDYRK